MKGGFFYFARAASYPKNLKVKSDEFREAFLLSSVTKVFLLLIGML
jgi:hypothetical protein